MTIKLNENEMDRASLILAAKAVVDDLQDMAEKVAKMEAEGIMPLLDGIRTSFGPEFADRFSDVSTQALRSALESLKTAKEHIGSNIDSMEQIVTGEGPGNDMANNLGVPQEPEVAPENDDQSAAEVEGDAAAEPADDAATEDDVEDVFGDEAPVGRAQKESAIKDPINMLRESKDPDTFLLTETFKRMKKGMKGLEAINETAAVFGVDAEDIIAIVKERQKK